jgi:hypothetical protein
MKKVGFVAAVLISALAAVTLAAADNVNDKDRTAAFGLLNPYEDGDDATL